MVTMTEIMNSARECLVKLKKEEGVIPEKFRINMEFEPKALDYDIGDLYICGDEFYADSPNESAELYIYLAPYCDVKSRKEKLRERRSRK